MVSNIFDGKKLDFSEKSESPDSSDSSVLTYEAGAGGSYCKEKSSAEDDDASVWSIQVNASTRDEDEEEIIEEEDYYDEEADEIEEEEDGGLVDELCEGISKIFVDEKRVAPKFAGKHTRFVYDSDDELVGEEEGRAEIEGSGGVSPSVLRLKGLPTPKGKHLRFPVQAEEEEEDN